jgi:hypothetical protein
VGSGTRPVQTQLKKKKIKKKMHLIVLIHDRTGHNCLVGYRETDPDDSKKAWSTIHILLLSCHSNLCNWMRSSRVWMRSSRVWMRSSRVWMRSSRVWMRSSRLCMSCSRKVDETLAEWLKRVWLSLPKSQQSWVRSLHPPTTVESERWQRKQC